MHVGPDEELYTRVNVSMPGRVPVVVDDRELVVPGCLEDDLASELCPPCGRGRHARQLVSAREVEADRPIGRAHTRRMNRGEATDTTADQRLIRRVQGR